MTGSMPWGRNNFNPTNPLPRCGKRRNQHADTAETIDGIAGLREAQGNSEEARDWYTRALEIREQAIGTHRSKTMEIRKHLITLLHTIERHEEAAQLAADPAEQSVGGMCS